MEWQSSVGSKIVFVKGFSAGLGEEQHISQKHNLDPLLEVETLPRMNEIEKCYEIFGK
jgi:hypothetical protein